MGMTFSLEKADRDGHLPGGYQQHSAPTEGLGIYRSSISILADD